ncbi:MFS transporter [Desulfurococcaceae archaeon AG1]|nr:MFS transporter [Desulfurococcaceae archaeon AG1]
MIILSFMVTLGRQLITSILTIYFLYRGLTYEQVGILFSTYTLAITLTSIWVGGLADRFGRKKILMVGSLIYSLSLYLISFPESFAYYLTAYTALALGTSSLMGVLTAWYFTEVAKYNIWDEGERIYSVARTLNYISILLANIATSFLLILTGDMALIFKIAALVNLFALILIILLVSENYGDREGNYLLIIREGINIVLANKIMLMLTISNIIYGILQSHFILTWQIYFHSILNFPEEMLGFIYTLYTIGGIIGSTIASIIGGKYTSEYRSLLLVVLSALISILYALPFFVLDKLSSLIWMLIFNLILSIYTIYNTILFNKEVPSEYRATAASAMFTLSSIASSLSLYIFGVIVNTIGLRESFILVSSIHLVQIFIFLIIYRFYINRSYNK